MGFVAECDVLVHALDMGNKSVHIAARRTFLARIDAGRSRRMALVDQLRIALGYLGADEHFPLVVSSRCGIIGLAQPMEAQQAFLAGIALASAIFFACVTPWLIRNHSTFGRFIFVRDNFGAELRMGNGPGADGTWMEYLHPTQNVFALHQYQSLGELDYVALRKSQAVAFIKADYSRFAALCLKRFVYFWAGPPKATQPPWLSEVKNSAFLASSILMFWGLGRALRLRKPGARLFFWLILLCPAVYYIVFPAPRYRHPIEPEMTILCVFLITEAIKGEEKAPSVRNLR